MSRRKVGPTALVDLLDQLGLEIVKKDNTRANLGRRAELVLCENFDIHVADPPNQWVERPRDNDDGMAPMRGHP